MSGVRSSFGHRRTSRVRFLAAELDSLTGEHLRGIAMDESGGWVHNPWSRRPVHFLDGEEFPELWRNYRAVSCRKS